MRLKQIEAMVARSPLGWGQFLPSVCTRSEVPPPYSPEILSDSSPEPGPPTYAETTASQDEAPETRAEDDPPPEYSP